MTLNTSYRSWILLGVSVCAWLAVCFLAWEISNEASARISSQTSALQSQTKEESVKRMRTLARDTKDARAQLDAYTHVEVVTMVDAIDAIGKAAGVNIEIGQAVPDTSKSATHAVNFEIQADGSFSALFQAATLFESLPLPSSLEQLRFNHNSLSGNPENTSPWHMTARMKIITSADISS